MKSFNFTLAVMILSGFFTLCGCHQALAWKPDFIPPPHQLEKLEKENDKRRLDKNTTMVMWGKVVDFDGQPVPDAEVTMRLSAVPPSVLGNDQTLVKISTNESGLFRLEKTGFLYYLAEIKAEGYRFRMEYNKERSLEFQKGKKHLGKGYEPDKPMVFRMRKLAPAAYLTSSNWEFGLKGDKVQLLDMYEHMWASPDRVFTLKMGSPHWHPDVKFSVETAGNNFQLVLEALDEDSGFIEQKAEFYEELTRAPETGYQQKISVPVNRNSGGNLMLYVKSEGGLFYSRMWVRYSHDGRYDGVRVNVSEATNPTGETILENDHERYRQRSRDSDAGKYWKLSRELLRKGELYIPQPEPKP